ncbi:MAG TPA: LysR family transcriptional regulator [Alphaproteobacteria bacterium]|nr:LysR family transcriptional regulator [Alphaproteobacteria bacterium]
MEWSDLRYVLAAARAGTLAAAARRLGVDQTTVSRRIAAAERAIGARLFERVDGALSPTTAGSAAIARAAQVEEAAAALERDIAGADAATEGLVRITAVPLLVNRVLIPALPKLLATQPRLRIELIAEPRNLSLTRREADIAVRLARPKAGVALTRRIGRLDYATYARRGARSEDLPWITYEEGQSHLPQARWIAARNDGEGPLLVNDAEGLLSAVVAGLGRSLLPALVAERDPRLVRLGPPAVLSREIWLMVHRDLRDQARIAAALGWLADTLRATRRVPAAQSQN